MIEVTRERLEQLEEALTASYQVLEAAMSVLRTLSIDRDQLSPVQVTVYDSAHARGIRQQARATAAQLVSKYDELNQGN